MYQCRLAILEALRLQTQSSPKGRKEKRGPSGPTKLLIISSSVNTGPGESKSKSTENVSTLDKPADPHLLVKQSEGPDNEVVV
jgi:hypothetical protein